MMFIDSAKHITRLHSIVDASLARAKMRDIPFEGEEIVRALHRNGFPADEENLQKVQEIIEEFS